MLSKKILSKSAKIGIVGLGYVGLPLAMLCAENGYKVLGIDKDENKIKNLRKGKSYISDVNDIQLQSVMNLNKLDVTTNFSLISSCDIILICVPTPLTLDGKPNYSFLFKATESIKEKLREEQLIILESTLVPQTTRNSIIPSLEKTGLKAGKDFFIAYSPERIDPGNKIYVLENIPKLVSGYTNRCRTLADMFYNQLCINTFTVNSLEVAEMSKILENTYRDINIAFINEMAEICHLYGLNSWEVIEAAASKPFGFQPFYPGPGVGGHCIPKDSTYYSYWAKAKKKTVLTEYAREINNNMPNYIVMRLEELLVNRKMSLSGRKILILGVTFKKDVNDLRESPTLKIIELLLSKGVEVFFHDPYIKQLNINGNVLRSIDFDTIKKVKQDCIVLSVAHSFYSNYQEFNSNLIFDLTNTIGKNVSNVITL